jgi:hypothetical protein
MEEEQRVASNGLDTRVPPGTYKENPAETMRICDQEGCGRSFHHSGYAPHVAACVKRTKEEREHYVTHQGKYAYQRKGRPRVVQLPVRIETLTSAAPKRPLKHGLPAPVALATIEGDQRVALHVSVDRRILMQLLNTIKFE